IRNKYYSVTVFKKRFYFGQQIFQVFLSVQGGGACQKEVFHFCSFCKVMQSLKRDNNVNEKDGTRYCSETSSSFDHSRRVRFNESLDCTWPFYKRTFCFFK